MNLHGRELFKGEDEDPVPNARVADVRPTREPARRERRSAPARAASRGALVGPGGRGGVSGGRTWRLLTDRLSSVLLSNELTRLTGAFALLHIS